MQVESSPGHFMDPVGSLAFEANNAYIHRVDRPQDEPFLVALQRLRRCPDEIADEFQPPDSRAKKQNLKPSSKGKVVDMTESVDDTVPEEPTTPLAPGVDEATGPPNKGKYTGVLRHHPRTADAKPGDV